VQVDVPLSNMWLNLFVEGRQKLVRGRIFCNGEIKKGIKKENCVVGIILRSSRRRWGCA
jgi:hypothetical protein